MGFRDDYKIKSLSTFRMGLNTQQDDDEIADAELSDVENYSIEEDSIRTSAGFVQWDDNPQAHPGPYWGGVMFKKADLTMVDIRQRQDILEYSDDGIQTWVACTLPGDQLSLTEIPCTFATLNDTVIWTNGTDFVMSSTDGHTWTKQASLPKSKVVFNNGFNRLLFLGQPASPFRVDWTGINTPTTLESYQLIDPNLNGVIVGAAKTPWGTTLIHKERGLYELSDIVDDGILDVNFIGGAITSCHQSIQTTEDSVIWYAWGPILEYKGGVINIINGRIAVAGTEERRRRNDTLKVWTACSTYYNGKYRLSIADTTISDDYNSQEYVIYKQILRNDPVQPYAITRNRRYIGMYFIEDNVYDYGRDITLFIGDSRPETTTGSPAQYVNTWFGWSNDYRNEQFEGIAVLPGLNGEAQEAYFITKYFTENVPYVLKEYKKIFLHARAADDATVTIGYRFTPYDTFTEVSLEMSQTDLNWIYDDEDEGPFDEGFGFSQTGIEALFVDIESHEEPRGIQFKISTNEIKDITFYSLSYKYRKKQIMK